MSTKTIALDSRVYQKLAGIRNESESFSKLINRLVEKVTTAHTVTDVLAHLDEYPALSEEDTAFLSRVVRENRDTEDWSHHDLS